MCDPISITGLVISAAASAAAYKAQADQAKAQAKYQNTVAQQTGELASQSYQNETQITSERLLQNASATGQQADANAQAGAQVRATSYASAIESGVEGNSVDQLMQDFNRQQSLNALSLSTNSQWVAQQAYHDEEAMRAEAEGRIASSRPGPVNMPSTAALALNIGGAAVASYDGYLHRQPVNPNSQASGSQGSWFTRPLPGFRRGETFSG